MIQELQAKKMKKTTKNLQINRAVFFDWLNDAGLTLEEFAREKIEYDLGNFSKMLRGQIPTPKHILEKVLEITNYKIDRIIEFH
jgi:hypothetical protein